METDALVAILHLDVNEKGRQGNVKALSNLAQVIQRNVAPALLDTNQVRAIHTDHLGKLVLREVLSLSQAANSRAHS